MLLTVGWDFKSLTQMWLIPVKAPHMLFATDCLIFASYHISFSFFFFSHLIFLRTLLQAGKHDHLRFQDICNIQPMALGFYYKLEMAFPGGAVVKNLPANAKGLREVGSIPGSERWFPWRRKWQPTPVFLPGESHGQRSLAGHSP